MMKAAKLLATSLGIGYIQKGAGTVAALFCCGLWYWLAPQPMMQVLITLAVLAAGLWASTVVEAVWEHDSNRIVIDEVLGMCVTLLWVPLSPAALIIGFVLFRLLDIFKPLAIRRAEELPRGWGVMGDDLLAGVYANLLLQLLVWKHVI